MNLFLLIIIRLIQSKFRNIILLILLLIFIKQMILINLLF